MARKNQLLRNAQREVLVLTSRALLESWSSELQQNLKDCARRGLCIRLLVENSGISSFPALEPLRASGIEVRQSAQRFSWMFRSFPVQGEMWIFDRAELVTGNQRVSGSPSSRPLALAVECLLGADAALGTASYFEQRWESAAAAALNFSIRQKNYAFHSGTRARGEFFACLLNAQREITLSLPGERISRGVSQALHAALTEGLKVTIFANAESSDAPGLRRLRRLAAAGASVKICGRRLKSECAIVDGTSIYMGSFPSSWQPFARGTCPVFVVQDRSGSAEILAALEAQVSVEINGDRTSHFYAYR